MIVVFFVLGRIALLVHSFSSNRCAPTSLLQSCISVVVVVVRVVIPTWEGAELRSARFKCVKTTLHSTPVTHTHTHISTHTAVLKCSLNACTHGRLVFGATSREAHNSAAGAGAGPVYRVCITLLPTLPVAE